MQNEHNKFFLGECKFLGAFDTVDSLPKPNLPEVAFLGISNVGKSSLLNALTNRKHLARTSSTPGCTKTINFFCIRDALLISDLPGYGYAKTSRVEVGKWKSRTLDYLTDRGNLKRVFLLIDIRRGLKEKDAGIMRIFDEAGVGYQIILTKSDKVKKNDLEKTIADINEQVSGFVAIYPEIIITSSRTSGGIEDLREEIFNLVK